MRKTLLLTVLMALTANAALADKITVERAMQIASEFVGDANQQRQRSADATATLQLAATADGYYAFNRANKAGYVIVCDDDRAANSVLGYADEGTFDPDNMPEAMAWLLSEYTRELSAAVSAPQLQSAERTAATRSDIAPMLPTLWGQEEPYNALCPTYRGMACPTGCVATAFSQIMRYHEWPTTGTGSHSYQWELNGTVQSTLSSDFSQHTYQWGTMANNYLNGGGNDAANAAVAQLMYDLGVAFEMEYNPDGSGANNYVAASAMTEYFGYAKDMHVMVRDFYGADEWTDMLYTELAEGRPVYYAGSASAGAHAFVFDGYRDGYFHVNWGWDGNSNGYFLITALDPATQGVGGSNAGFNYEQEAVFGMKPATGGEQSVALMYCQNGFTTSTRNATVYSNVTFSGGFYNYSLATLNLTLGIMAVSEAGDTTFVEASGYTTDLPTRYGWDNYTVPMRQFPDNDGTYLVYPAYRDNATNQWHEMRTKISASYRSVTANVQGGVIYFTQNTQTPSLTISGIEALTTPYADNYFQVKATVTNNGEEFYDDLWMAVVTTGSLNVQGTSPYKRVNLKAGESRELTFELMAPSQAGSYQMVVALGSTVISQRVNITVQSTPSGALSLSLDGPLTVTQSPSTEDNTLTLTANINCSGGTYNEGLVAYVYPIEGGYAVASYTANLFIASGESRTVTFSGTFESGNAGSQYYARVYYVNGDDYELIPSESLNQAVFTYLQSTTIDTTIDNAKPRNIEIYTLSSNLVLKQTATKPDLSTLNSGIYIVKDGDSVRKMVKK